MRILVKKNFLHGFCGKADWKLNGVILVGVLIMFTYLRIGRADWSKQIAADVSSLWKYFVLLLMLVVSAYTCRLIYRGLTDRTLPRMNPVWLGFEITILFIFALISADKQTLFNVGTLLWAAILFGMERYYSRAMRTRVNRGTARTNRK